MTPPTSPPERLLQQLRDATDADGRLVLELFVAGSRKAP